MDVASFMTTDPVTVAPDRPIADAMRLMDDCVIRHLPVVDAGRLIGVVSDRDCLGATGWRILGPRAGAAAGTRTVADVMEPDVVTVAPDEQVVSALVEVLVRGIGCLPVVREEELVGIVTQEDVMTLYVRACREEGRDQADDPAVGRIGRSEAVVVGPRDPVALADELCHEKGFHHLPVVADDGGIVGMISDRDLRRAAGAGLAADSMVESVMTQCVLQVAFDDPLSLAARMMIEHKVSALPITGDGPVGIVTSIDVLDHATAVLRGSVG